MRAFKDLKEMRKHKKEDLTAVKDLKEMIEHEKKEEPIKKVREEPTKRVTLDVLKPHKPDIVAFGKAVCADKSIRGLSISVYAVDEKTESIKMILEGPDIDFERVKEIIHNLGAVIHSIDFIVVGKKETIV